MFIGATRFSACAARRNAFLATSIPARHRFVAHCEVRVAGGSGGGGGGNMPKTSILWFRKVPMFVDRQRHSGKPHTSRLLTATALPCRRACACMTTLHFWRRLGAQTTCAPCSSSIPGS